MFPRISKFFLLGIGALLLAAGAHAGPIPTTGSTTAQLQAAVNGHWRSAAHKARDKYRHPVKTLEFFGIRPNMTVIELDAGGGWYTEILAPFLYAHGHLIEPTVPASASKYALRSAKKFNAKLKADPAVYGHVERGLPFAPPSKVKLGPDNSADMVLTFRNVHDFLNAKALAPIFKAAYDVLKPGGVFGITDHRARANANAVVVAHKFHRITEDYVINAGLKAGFRLAGVSEINANPKDPENISVFRLPPTLHDPSSERAKMKAIGESDVMTIKFVKP
ncbi:MAG: class I SAM-dependent methyltransferase [Gammaproteobacteria bacterium]